MGKQAKPPRRSVATKKAIQEAKLAKIELKRRKIKKTIAEYKRRRAIHLLKAQKYNDAIARLKAKLK